MDAQNVSLLIVIMSAHLGGKGVLQLRPVVAPKYAYIWPCRMLFFSSFFITLHDIINITIKEKDMENTCQHDQLYIYFYLGNPLCVKI